MALFGKEKKMKNNFWKQLEKDIVIHNDKMNITESCVDRHAKSTPNKPALIFQDGKSKKIIT